MSLLVISAVEIELEQDDIGKMRDENLHGVGDHSQIRRNDFTNITTIYNTETLPRTTRVLQIRGSLLY